MNAHQRRVKRRRLERSYEGYLDACAARCRCCPDCRSGTCDGVLQGASCDGLCFCSQDEDHDADDHDYYDDGSEPFVSTCPGGPALF